VSVSGRPRLRLIGGDLGSKGDPVPRLQAFRAAYPQVKILSPYQGGQGRYIATIPTGTVPGLDEDRTVENLGLSGLMDQLDGLWPPGGAASLLLPGLRGNEGALADPAHDEPSFAELLHRAPDGEVPDSPLFGQVALGRQLLAGLQLTRGDRGGDVVGGLLVQRRGRARVERGAFKGHATDDIALPAYLEPHVALHGHA
jgi:hypothetical protein